MRILLLVERLPYPELDGYGLRYAHYLRRLASRHEIDVLSYAVGELVPELRQQLGHVERVPLTEFERPSLTRRAADAFTERGLHHRYPAFVAAIEHQVRTCRYDVAWVGGWRMAQYMELLGDLPAVLDAADDEVVAAERRLASARGAVERIAGYRQVVMQGRYQRRFFPRADICTFVAAEDARSTGLRIPGLRVEVLSNGVDTDFFSPGAEFARFPASDRPTLVFEGTMSFGPNAEGALHLVREVLPRVRRELPDVRVVLVGRDPGPELLALAGEHVEVTDTVPDVRPHVAAAGVFVCPLLGGAGIKNKILQAWGLARPVVATPISVGGLVAEDGRELLLGADADAFAAACVRVLRDAALAANLGAAGRRTAVAHYSWDDCAHRLEGWLTEAAASHLRAT
jgi:glycosyltransferase involved in cell wall biosynthesis